MIRQVLAATCLLAAGAGLFGCRATIPVASHDVAFHAAFDAPFDVVYDSVSRIVARRRAQVVTQDRPSGLIVFRQELAGTVVDDGASPEPAAPEAVFFNVVITAAPGGQRSSVFVVPRTKHSRAAPGLDLLFLEELRNALPPRVAN